MPVVLGIIGDIVLGRRNYSFALNAANIGDSDSRRQQWVLSEILEVTTSHWGTVDVHSRRQQNMPPSRSRIRAERFANLFYQRRVPRSGQGDSCRIGRSRAPYP